MPMISAVPEVVCVHPGQGNSMSVANVASHASGARYNGSSWSFGPPNDFAFPLLAPTTNFRCTTGCPDWVGGDVKLAHLTTMRRCFQSRSVTLREPNDREESLYGALDTWLATWLVSCHVFRDFLRVFFVTLCMALFGTCSVIELRGLGRDLFRDVVVTLSWLFRDSHPGVSHIAAPPPPHLAGVHC